MFKKTLFVLAASMIIANHDPQIEVTVVETGLNEDEIDILAQLTMAEAEGESELGKRLVIDTVLNRIESDDFPDDLRGVIEERGQFSCMTNGRFKKCSPTWETRELVREEILERTNTDVLYFRSGHYGSGSPLFKEDHHYFSGKESKNE